MASGHSILPLVCCRGDDWRGNFVAVQEILGCAVVGLVMQLTILYLLITRGLLI